MENRKIVIIGAGSAMFTQGLLTDLADHPGNFKWHVALVDIDGEVLESIARLVQKIFDSKKADVNLTWDTERCQVLEGADYVVNTIGVGGRRAWEKDVYIPRKYGVNQPVGDTAMPGGISRALRMIPQVIAIAEDVMRLCPDAFFINYSNPMSAICRAVTKKVPGIKMAGLCIGVPGTIWSLAENAGLPKEECTASWGGINHCTFIYDFRHNGVPAFDKVLKGIEGEDLTELDDIIDPHMNEGKKKKIGEPFAYSYLRENGAYLSPGDRHVTEFFTEYFPGGRYYGKTLGKDAYSFEGTITWGDAIHERALKLAESPEPLDESYFTKNSGEHEQLMEIIHSMENDGGKIFSANVVNHGTLNGVLWDAVVEVPCIAGAHGIKPIAQPEFPAVFAAQTNRFLAVIEMMVEAAIRGEKKLVEQAILMGGYLPDQEAVEKMTEELLEAQKEYLPQFEQREERHV